jgi:hypothetical protein
MKKIAIVLAMAVAFICGMYAQVAWEDYQLDQQIKSETLMDQHEDKPDYRGLKELEAEMRAQKAHR